MNGDSMMTSDEPGANKKKAARAPKILRAAKKGDDRAEASTQPIELRWDLHELPSSQHRAGLAGLALCVAFLNRKSATERKGTCFVKTIDNAHLVLVVDRDGMQSLFDDVYAAKMVETLSKTKWPGAEHKRIVEITISDETADKPKPENRKPKTKKPIAEKPKTKTEKRFVYDRVVPKGELVGDWDTADSEEAKLWLKLWRDMVWTILRGVPAQREPYNARAEARPIDDGGEAWDELTTKPASSVDLPSTYYLGAQAKNAENVPFEDVARFRFLLHFWAFVAAIYVPATLQRDGTRNFIGFALAIPDIARLEEFVSSWEYVARARGIEVSGYRPRDSVIDLAAEAGLDVVRRCNERIAAMQGNLSTHYWLTGVDVFHLEKDGNNVRMRGISRIVPERRVDAEYAIVRHANYWSPLFRRQRIENIIEQKRWWFGFARLCSITPDEMTIRHQQFQHDCKAAFTEVEMKQDVEENEQTLEHLIYRRVQSYVLGKTERKYALAWKVVKDDPTRRKEFDEKKEKVAREAFLAVRSRTGADFIAYFTSTICSVPYNVTEAKYLEVARALTDPSEVERVRSLTLLALSAVA